jgi:arginyl-tRNA--protein-N-Asp/Glu arginylyltransferase
MSGYGRDRSRPGMQLYLSGEHPCSYLPGLRSRTLFVDPMARMDGTRYQLLLEHGFRRSGAHIYRPECDGCHRCVAVRIPVAEFVPNRSQRRNAAVNNKDLTLIERPARFYPEHYSLYTAYLRHRHPGGGMSQDLSPENYHDFLITPWGGETLLLELRLKDRLAAVAVTDVLPLSLSAVYTFFDPELSGRALGNYGVLIQIAQARRFERDHLYLGYWIQECRKMSYKDKYRPLEAFLAGHWQRFGRGESIKWR